jgi:pyruvate dehydrogenase E2 component (dihydrolipoamide acetyltransferase)
MRSVIAKRLLESKTTIPHFYLQREINSEPVRLARESINESLSHDSSNSNKVSMNDVILLACAKTILRFPEINSSWSESEITYHGNVHLAFGVAVEDGLVTPVIRNAESLDLRSISETAKALILKSRNKKLTPDEMSGSTFTVTNLGMYGIDFFSGIINPPNAAILSVGGSIKKPVVDKNDMLRAGETMTLGLSCDHRLVDGAIGAQFLASLAAVLENPARLLVL